MSRLVFLAVLFISLFSVFIEYDTLTGPNAPAVRAMQVAGEPQPATLPKPETARAAPSSTGMGSSDDVRPAELGPLPDTVQADASSSTFAQALEKPAPPPNCNVAACAASYRSFTAEDCTWQPYIGPRLVCTK